MINAKLKGGALYVSVIISILTTIILSLYILVAYYNSKSINSQNSLTQLQLSMESGFEIAKSYYYNANLENKWQKTAYNNDSIMVKKMIWGCFTLVDVKAKNTHFNRNKTGLFGALASMDTALMLAEQNKPISLAGKIKFTGSCFLPKEGIKSAYIEGTSFTDLNSIKPYIKQAPKDIPEIDENFLNNIEQSRSEINVNTDSLMSFIPKLLNQSWHHKTAVFQEGRVILKSQVLTNNIKIIASELIIVENTSQLNNVLLIARKVIFKKGFEGIVHVIARDTIVAEDECDFKYPSSFCVYYNPRSITTSAYVRGVFFGTDCKFKGGILAANDKNQSSQMMIKLNKEFEFIGSMYSSNYTDTQGNLYGSVYSQSLLAQTPSNTYENHILNCTIDPKKYGVNLTVPNWFNQKEKLSTCAKWF